jgi:hypothetical protein
MISFNWWQKWLVVLGCIVTTFGTFMALANAGPLFELFNQQIDPVFWNGQALPDQALAFRTWVYGAWGGTVAGWGIFMIFLASRPFKGKESWAWWCLVVGLGWWYILDSGLSWYAGVTFNVIFNSILLIAAAVPLISTAPSFLKSNTQT